MKCAWIRQEPGFVVIPDSKDSSARHVAISDRAYAGLPDLTDREPADSKVFRFSSGVADNGGEMRFVSRRNARISGSTISDMKPYPVCRRAAPILRRSCGRAATRLSRS